MDEKNKTKPLTKDIGMSFKFEVKPFTWVEGQSTEYRTFMVNDVLGAVTGLKEDVMSKDLSTDSLKEARKKMCALIDFWFPVFKEG